MTPEERKRGLRAKVNTKFSSWATADQEVARLWKIIDCLIEESAMQTRALRRAQSCLDQGFLDTCRTNIEAALESLEQPNRTLKIRPADKEES